MRFSTVISKSCLSNQQLSFLITYPRVGNIILSNFCSKLFKKLEIFYPIDSFTVTYKFHNDKNSPLYIVLSFKNIVDINVIRGITKNEGRVTIVKTPQRALMYILKDIPEGSKPTMDSLYSTFLLSELEPLYGKYNQYRNLNRKELISKFFS